MTKFFTLACACTLTLLAAVLFLGSQDPILGFALLVASPPCGVLIASVVAADDGCRASNRGRKGRLVAFHNAGRVRKAG